MRRSVVLGSLLAFVVGGGFAVSAPGVSAAPAAPGVVTEGVSYAATDQVIVSFRTAAGAAGARATARAAASEATVARTLDARTVVVKLPSAQSGAVLRATVGTLAAQPGVAWAEPDVRMFPAVSPYDPQSQWDLGPATGAPYGINAASAWGLTTGSSAVKVAVIDTGYVEHADLSARILPGYDFISDSRIANDGNGRDADAHDPGDWITSTENASGFFAGCGVSNSSWHGTHVAGTIGAVSNNGVGVTGINWVSGIVPVRVLGKCGGYTSDITDGVRWAAGLTVSGAPANANPVRVVNLSLGGSGACSSTWQNAINAVTAVGVVVVVAAGNSNANAANYSPASCTGVVTVASTGKAGSRAYYSNYGATVEIAAPGGDKNADAGDTIVSTLNTGTTTPVASPAGDTYVKYQGTSMATPHVVGVVSLMLSVNAALTPSQVTSLLQSTATPFPAGSTCSTTTCGAGIVNAGAAVTAASAPPPPPPPSPPGAFSKSSPANNATNRNRILTLSWGASSGATSYQYCIDTTLNGACNGSWTSTGTSRSVTVSLARRTTYEWQVRAVNGAGSTDADAGTWWRFTTR
jgi:serine protease